MSLVKKTRTISLGALLGPTLTLCLARCAKEVMEAAKAMKGLFDSVHPADREKHGDGCASPRSIADPCGSTSRQTQSGIGRVQQRSKVDDKRTIQPLLQILLQPTTDTFAVCHVYCFQLVATRDELGQPVVAHTLALRAAVSGWTVALVVFELSFGFEHG
jgi:hypothetical protein